MCDAKILFSRLLFVHIATYSNALMVLCGKKDSNGFLMPF